jgi:hypothetical protein
MNRERLEQFRSRFGIQADEGEFARFQTRVVHAAKTSLWDPGNRGRIQLEKEFALRNGSELTLGGYGGVYHGIIEELQGAKSFVQLIDRTQQLLWSFERLGYFKDVHRYSEDERVGLMFAEELRRAIELSVGIDVRLQAMADRVELVPAGVAIMDDAVDGVTQWLSRYPDVQKEFRQTLTILAEKKREQYRQAQDSLRFALEKLLKLILGNNIRLEEQGKNLKEWLAHRGVSKNLRGAAVQIMILLSKEYQNATVKHDNAVADGNAKEWADHEVEYLLYQYTTLLRLLLEASEHGSPSS